MRRILSFAIFLMTAMPAFAADSPIQAFFGHYTGSGVAQTPDSLYFDTSPRDMDVRIEAAGQGFRVAWTTVLVKNADTEAEKIVRKSSELTFQSGGQPNLFVSGSGNVSVGGAPYAWARISEQTLTVYIFELDGNGVYSLASYARTLVPGGMELEFQSIRDGHPVRTVKGRLVKDG